MDLAVSMGSCGVSEVSAGTGERIGSMINGTCLTSGSGAYGDRDSVNNEFAYNWVR